MKKIFLIPLLTLMCSITAWAEIEPVNVDSEAGMREALEAAASQDSTEITLTGDINFNATSFVVPEGARVLLNLNGHSITSTYTCRGGCDMREDAIFWIKGLLHIVSEGYAIVSKPVGTGNFDSGSAIFAPDAGTLIIDGGIYLGGYCDAGEGFVLYVQLPIFWSYSYTEPERKSNIIINGGTFLTTTHSTAVNFGMFQKEGISPNYSISGGIFSKTLDAGYLAANMETASVPYKNANITGYDATAKTVYAVVPTEGAQQITENTEINSDTEYAFLYVDPGKTLTIKDGKKLTIGDAGAILGGSDSKIIIEAGGTLVCGGDIVTSSEENLELTMDAVNNKFSYLLIQKNAIQEKHPNATVVLKSKAYHNTTLNKDVFQRFAVPTYLPNLLRNDMQYDHEAAPTAVYRWDYSLNDWKVMKSTDTDNRYYLPFHCYEMTTDNVGTPYTFQCELVGNGTPELELHGKWNYYANSYTAPIDIVTMIQDIEASYAHIKPAVWVHNGTRNGWDAIAALDVEDYVDDPSGAPLSQTKIEPMQAFVYNWVDQTVTTKPELKYDSYVYDPIVPSNSNNAPARRAASSGINYTRATITVTDASGEYNTLKMYESEEFGAFDNNYSVEKLMNKDCFNMYFVTADGAYSNIAAENFANTAITLQTKEATSYTINFKNVTLEGYAIRDNLTGTVTAIANGNSYNFSTGANSTVAGRFEVIKVHNAPTAIENTAEAVQNKGIYTLTGLYMGEDYHALPSGMYIINGKKVVK